MSFDDKKHSLGKADRCARYFIFNPQCAEHLNEDSFCKKG
jgi:hypothetical protein